MRKNIIIVAVLLITFIGMVSIAGTIKKDGENLTYIPYFTSDNTQESITIDDIGTTTVSAQGKAFVSDVLYKYLVKYEPNPSETFTVDSSRPTQGSVDDNGIVTTTYYIKNDNAVYKVTYSTDPDIWIKVTITNTVNYNSYSELKNIAVSRF